MVIKKGLSTWEEKNCVFASYRVLIHPCTIGYLLVYRIDALQMLHTFCLCENVPDFFCHFSIDNRIVCGIREAIELVGVYVYLGDLARL